MQLYLEIKNKTIISQFYQNERDCDPNGTGCPGMIKMDIFALGN